MPSAAIGALERKCRGTPFAVWLLARQDKAREARSDQACEIAREELTPASLRIDCVSYLLVKRAHRNRTISVPL